MEVGRVILQTAFIILWITGLLVLVIGIWYSASWLILLVVSKMFSLTGRRTRSQQHRENR